MALESSVIVLVDARNVLRSQWPNIPEEDLVRLTCAWATEKDVRAEVIFDGQAPEGPDGEHCEVVGTKDESADEWLIRRAGELRDSGEQFRLVTSDRALRAAASTGAERTIGGGSFANELRPPAPRRAESQRSDRSIQTEPPAKPAPPEDGTASGAS